LAFARRVKKNELNRNREQMNYQIVPSRTMNKTFDLSHDPERQIGVSPIHGKPDAFVSNTSDIDITFPFQNESSNLTLKANLFTLDQQA
jgi:hypothetical protein